MKRTPLKRKTKNPLITRGIKLDRAYQDVFREICWTYGIPCEVSSQPMEVVHHYYEKRLSANLRFNPINFVPITSSIHTQHHRGQNPDIVSKINENRGELWKTKIRTLKNITVGKGKTYLDEADVQLFKIQRHEAEMAEYYKENHYFPETLYIMNNY